MKLIRSKILAVTLAIMVATTFIPTGFSYAEETGTDNNATVTAEQEAAPQPAKEETERSDSEEPEPAAQPASEPEPAAETSQSAASDPAAASPSDSSKDAEDSSAAGSKASKTTEKKESKDSSEKSLKKASGNAAYEAVDNSTSLEDGEYKAEDFTFEGGTGKTTLSCDKIVVAGGKAKAVIRISSDKFTHVFTGKVNTKKNTDEENTDLYDPSTGKTGEGVYDTTAGGSGVTASIPVSLNQKMNLAGRTTAMSEAHWIQYAITVKVSDEDKTSDETTIEDGTYKPDSFTFEGGTGKATMTCEKVIVKDGKAYAVFTSSSDKTSHIYMGSVANNSENKALYDPDTDTCGADVYKIYDKNVAVPVELNADKPCATRTTAMSEPHWINYTYHIELSAASDMISHSTDIPDFSGESTEPEDPSGDDPAEEEDPAEPDQTQKLKPGTYKAKATTCRVMFYLYPKEENPAQVILKVKKNGKMTATITLSGEGYDYVYMGSAAKAKKAPKSSWIKAKIVNGYYTFTIPVSKLDKKLTIAPHSKKYASDGDPSTEPWRDGKWIIIYSKGAKKVKDGTSAVPSKKKKKSEKDNKNSGTQTKFKNDHKADKESKWKDDSGKSTSAVDNSTSLKDGVYTPDRFSWSGGSGRLAYIKCNKITVKGGKAYATIEFGSTHYDSLKANGRVYSKQGGGNSQFVIPIKLNANNTIIGRTTAMSQPHWIKYTIFVYKAGATGKLGKTAKGDDGHLTSTKKLSDKAPDLMGLKFEGKTKVKYSKLFKIFRYEQGITLISIDQAKGTALYKKDSKEKASKSGDNNPVVEYDEEGKPIAKTDSERTNDLYQNNVINYLIVPQDVELPAGLEKDCVILEKPVDSTYIDSKQVREMLEKMGIEDSLKDISGKAGDYDDIDYKQIVRTKTDLAVLPSEVLPEAVTQDSSKDEKAAAEEKTKEVRTLQTRFSALNVPLLIDRSENEKTNYAQEEWIKVYGAIFGTEDKADAAFDKYVKKHKEKKLEAN